MSTDNTPDTDKYDDKIKHGEEKLQQKSERNSTRCLTKRNSDQKQIPPVTHRTTRPNGDD